MKQKQLLFLLALLITAATGAVAQTGVTKGLFSASPTKRVYFSKGNLQLVGENTFQFAENQWDVFGSSQSNGHRDLFGWGSANNPDLTSENNNDYSTFTDWGTKIGDGTTWRTLTNDEWDYVLNTRTASTLNGTENARYAYATVNGVGGLILFPDNYTHPGEVAAPTQINTPSTAFNANIYNGDDWLAMEGAGAVFLPHGGCRTGYTYQSNQPNYWSSTPSSTAGNQALGLNLSGMEFKSWFRFRGCAVRLVTDGYVLTLADGTQDAANWTIASGENSATGDNADGLTGLLEKDAVTLTYGGHLKVKSVTATTDAAPAATVVDLSTISGNTYTVTGDVILTGTPTESPFDIKYGGDDYEVTLDNVNSAGSKQVLVVGNSHNINIKLKGTSRLKEIFTNASPSGKTVTIGEAAAGGTLILIGSTDPIRAKSFTINGGTVKSQATGDNWAVYLNNSVGVLTINGGALYLAAGQDGTTAVKGSTVSGTLYGWDGSAWVTYTDQRYATTDNTSGNPTGWTW